MRLLPSWLREFVTLPVDDQQGRRRPHHGRHLHRRRSSTRAATIVYDVDITTNRVDAMNHYGVARDCAAIYDVDLAPSQPNLPK